MKRTILMAGAVFVLAMLAGVGGRVALTRPDAGKKGAASPDSTKAGIEALVPGDSSRAGSASVLPSAGLLPGADPLATPAPASPMVAPGIAAPALPGTAPVTPAALPGVASAMQEAARKSTIAGATDSVSSASADSEAAARATKLVARILVTMKGADAGKIMEGLTDDEVEGILRAVGVRQAAGLLPLLPSERAARLSRRLLENHPKGEK